MYCSKIKKTAGLLVCSLAFQFPAFAENTECPKVKNLTTDTFDKVLKWEAEGDNYEGAEIYTVTADGELEYFGNAEGTAISYGEEGTYLVKAVNGAEDDYGSVIAHSTSTPFTIILNEADYADESVRLDIRLQNNSSSYSGGVLCVKITDVEGKVISETENYMTVKPGKDSRLKITQPTNPKQYKMAVTFNNSHSGETELALPVVVTKDNPSAAYAEAVIEKNDDNAADILSLLNRCEEEGIPTAYEYANYKILDRFSDYIREDIDNGELSRIYYTENALDKIYTETKNNLNSYLSGVKTAVSVPDFVTGDLRVDGETMYAPVADADGTVSERPVYFVGYGHFATVKEDIEYLEALGMNTMQMEIGPSNAMLNTPAFENWGVEERGTPEYTFSVDTETYHGGAAAANICYPADSTGAVRVFQKVPVEPGKSYTFIVHVRSDSKATAVSCTADGYESTLNINGQYGWKKIKKTYTAPEGAVYTTVGLEIAGEAQLYIDDASFTENGSEVNLLVNGDFETPAGFEYSFDRYSENVLSVENALERAGECNISVCVLLSPHYFPKRIMDKYGFGFENGTAFIKYNIHAPEAKAVIERYMRGIIPVIKEYDSLSSICISNEPSFEIARAGDYFMDEWHQFLEDRYGTIENLSQTYGKKYSSFEDVGYDRGYYNYDYIEFVDGIFADWHRWMAEISKEEAPDIPIHSKLMGYLTGNSKEMNTFHCGADLAKYHDFLDWNGCDYANYIDNDGKPLAQELWYDYMRSVKNAPVINSEDHIIPNGDDNFDAEVADYVTQNLYMGAIHGRGMSDIWVWERSYDETSKFDKSILFRPDVLSAVTKTAMDINRNAYEINALQTKENDIGILYSKSSVLLDKTAMSAMYQAYASCMFNGLKPGFIISSQLEKLNNYEYVIIPDTKYVTPEILSAVKAYSENGGKLIIMGDSSFKYSDKKISNSQSVIDEIYTNAEVVDYTGLKNGIASSSETGFYKLMRNAFDKYGLCNIEVVDKLTGENVSYVQINSAEYDGKLILNMVSYDGDKNVDIYVNGEKVTEAYNIITDEYVTDFTLDKYIPVTLEM